MDEIWESSLRDQERQRAFNARNQRIAKLKQKPMSVRETLASGAEGRLFHSAAGKDVEGSGVTRAINDDAAVDVTPVEAGRVFAVEEAMREAQAASRAPVPSYMIPEDDEDPRAYEDLDAKFPNDEAAYKWIEETNASPATIQKLARIAEAQRNARAQIAELNALVPTWEADLPELVDWLKRTQGVTDAHLRRFFRAPQAAEFHAWWAKWKRAQRDAAFARSKKTGRRSDVGEAIATLLDDEPEPAARQRPEEHAAMMEGLRGARELPVHESVAEAGRYFAKALDLGLPDDGAAEEAEDRSLL